MPLLQIQSQADIPALYLLCATNPFSGEALEVWEGAEPAVDVVVTCGVETPPGNLERPPLLALLRSGSPPGWLSPWDGDNSDGPLGIWLVVPDLPDRGAAPP